MEEDVLRLFLKVSESFYDIKDKVSLIKPYFEIHLFSPGVAMKIEEFEKVLGFKPEFIHKSKEEIYAISVLYRVNDDITTGIIAHEFAEVVAREKNILGHETVDRICVERGFGQELLLTLQYDIIPLWAERLMISRSILGKRVENLKRLLQERH